MNIPTPTKQEIEKRLEQANARWDHAHGQWLKTRLSTWDEEVKAASWQIQRCNDMLDQILETGQ